MKNAAKPSFPAAVGARSLTPPPMPATVKAALPKPVVVDDALEEAEDLAAHDVAPVRGPATQALYDKQVLRAQVLAEQSAKLTAIEAGTYQAEPAIMPPAKAARAGRPKADVTGKAAVGATAKPRNAVRKAEEA